MSTKPAIVFAPGAWHRASAFQLVQEALQRRGWRTDAVEYPSVGAEPPTKGIPEDAAALRTILENLADQGQQIVLVAHSYGGLVCGKAVRGLGYQQRKEEGKTGGVITILYLAAFVLPIGMTCLKALNAKFLPWIRVDGDYAYADTPEEVFYHDVPLPLQKAAVANLAHQPLRIWYDEVEYEPWHDIHCLYFLCEDDRAVSVPAQEAMASVLGPDSIIFRSKSSHSPFFSAVQDVVDGVEKAAHAGKRLIEA